MMRSPSRSARDGPWRSNLQRKGLGNTVTVLYLVEDDDLKARTIERIVRLTRPELELVRFRNLYDYMQMLAMLRAPPRIAGVITDWSFPHYEKASPAELGNIVLDTLDGTPVQRIVVSGGDQPTQFSERYGGVRWLHLGQVAELQTWLNRL